MSEMVNYEGEGLPEDEDKSDSEASMTYIA